MTVLTWAEVYDDAVRKFHGQTPGRQLEAALVEHFETHPANVSAAIAKIATRFDDGKVRSPWPIVLDELSATERSHIKADDRGDRATAIRLAETWIRNAGLYAPLSEVHLELYDHGGRLLPWADDQELRARIDALWHREQPRAEQAHRETLERAERHRVSQAALKAIGRTTDHRPGRRRRLDAGNPPGGHMSDAEGTRAPEGGVGS